MINLAARRGDIFGVNLAKQTQQKGEKADNPILRYAERSQRGPETHLLYG